MAPTTTQLVGHVINSQYRLLEYLGSSEQGAVFLTDYGDSGQRAAIKLVVAHPATAEMQLARWELASEYPHPHLIQLFDAGRCEVADTDMLYVVMEYAPENLSQVLSERTLTAEETDDMLGPVLEVLTFLHGNGLAHGHLKASNILAIEDRLKLSSDSIGRFGEAWDIGREPDAYDAPENWGGKYAAPGDIWSLGMTLIEALTQRVPVFDSQQPPAPIVQDTLPAVFRDIAENCLIRDPELRWTVADVSGRMQGISPVVVRKAQPTPEPEAQAEAKPEPKPEVRPEPWRVAEPEVRRVAEPEARRAAEPEVRREAEPKASKTWLYGAAVVLVVAAIFAGPKLLHRSAPSTPEPETPIETPQQSAPSSPAPVNLKQQAPEKKAAAPSAAPTRAAASGNSDAGAASNVTAAKSSPGGAAQAVVVNKVLPNVSDRARATIHGTVHVAVKVDVDASGNVTNATLDPATGSSKYFAELSSQAARDWKFKPQEAPSRWVVHFLYTQADTTGFSTAP
jgi:serine/threonine protein kinase